MTNKRISKITKKPQSTYEEHIQNLTAKELKEHDKGYQELLLSELVIAAMQEDDVSVRALAKATKLRAQVII